MNNGNIKPVKILQQIAITVILSVFSFHTNAMGDVETDFSILQTEPDSIIAPNVFTPNGDSQNDTFIVKSSNENHTVALRIFTRAGVLVFSIDARICEWDGNSLTGREMANGVYYYTAEVVGVSPKITKCSFVHLFR